MQQPRPQQRAPGSFSPLPSNSPAPPRPQIRRIETSDSDDTISLQKTRGPPTPIGMTSPTLANPNSPQNFSRPARPSNDMPSVRTASPLTLPPGRSTHARKHSQTQGHFEPSLPSTSTSNLAQIGMAQPAASLSASQIAAQAAMQQQQQQQQQHSRNRSQTIPFSGSEARDPAEPVKRPGPKPVVGPRSPPMLSLTEASVPRDHGFGNQSYHNGLMGSHAAATAAANVVFPRTSPQSSPSVPTTQMPPPPPMPTSMPPPPPPLAVAEKPAKSEKSKVKLFSRPKKIDIRGDTKEKPLPSPGKIGSALASLQRGNFSSTSLADTGSFYNMANSSSATIRPVDAAVEREGREKEKERKHHFLSRQKHKLSNKDEYHLPLSSAASNSRPADPNAPSSLYNFNLPPSPGPNSHLAKSVSGLDLRHGGRALREKKKNEEKMGDIMRHDNDSTFALGSEWPGPGSLGSMTPSYFTEPLDSAKYGLNSMSLDDAWPYLRAKLLVIFEGEDLRLPVEDFNRVVTMHIQYCIQRRSAHMIIEDLQDMLATGFSSLDRTLRAATEDRLIPAIVELWIFTFTSILPYMQAVFLPLDLEFSGNGSLLTPEQAQDFWGGVVAAQSPVPNSYFSVAAAAVPSVAPASKVLEVRRLVLTAYRDALILPRYERLKSIFSRLSLEHLPSSLASLALASPMPPSMGMGIGDGAGAGTASLSTSPPFPFPSGSDAFASASSAPSQQQRPGTAMSLDPSVASYNSSSTTVFGNDSNPSRSRAISNVSYGSGVSDPASAAGGLLRPFTPQTRDNTSSAADRGGGGRETTTTTTATTTSLGSVREQNVEHSKQVTEMVGRMLQCMSVLASVSVGTSSCGHEVAGGGGAPGPGPGPTPPASLGAAPPGGEPRPPSSSGGAGSAPSSSSSSDDAASRMIAELGRLLKLNWLGRGRTGRNRRGMVGGRVRRPTPTDQLVVNNNNNNSHHNHNHNSNSAGGYGGYGGVLRESALQEGVVSAGA
ncbi:HbrB-like protein [Xylariaceae sp. FL0804]|nr:HbrB-like protein [Xylariaceae sp. FL0804]